MITNRRARMSWGCKHMFFIHINQEWIVALLLVHVVIAVRIQTVGIVIGGTIQATQPYAHHICYL